MKKILLALVVFIFSQSEVLAQKPQILIINQVRGEEVCCQSGSPEMVTSLKNDENLSKIPFTWALRFDALNKPYTELFGEKDSLGIVLEVTPRLAQNSGVKYKGKSSGEDWYSAKNAFLIGYTVEERKKIIDTVFKKFYETFGYYPKFTVSWMIDAWSVNYLSDAYGVKLHELTKEQYETDSYTLYGGVFNVPFRPSRNHPLIPGVGPEKLDVLMVRQTISDPVRNYGSSKAYFTSQPNDYLSNPENPTNYFQNLMESVMDQKENGFGLIGLENSFPWNEYGKEYKKQLMYLQSLERKKDIEIKSVDEFIESEKDKATKRFIMTEDVFWYFGDTYRARVVEKKGNLILDDLRIFSPQIEDPYKKNPALNDYAYWIVPYSIDGSQMYDLSEEDAHKKPDELLLGKTVPDTRTNPFGISIGKGKINENIGLLFKKDSIHIPKTNDPSFTNMKDLSFKNILKGKKEKILNFQRHPEFFLKPKEKEINVGWKNKEKEITVLKINEENENFILRPVLEDVEALSDFNMIFAPDKEALPLESKHTTVYWNNTRAIVDRNPVRVFILPLNKYQRPTSVKDIKVVEKTGNVNIQYPKDTAFKQTPWFIDITSKNTGNFKIDIILDGKTLEKGKSITFSPDCTKARIRCLLDPRNGLSYLATMIDEKRRELQKSP